MVDRNCNVPGCDGYGRTTRGMCDTHYSRWIRTGNAGGPIARRERYASQQDRFWSKVDKRGPDECWPWLGYVMNNGYGQFYFKKRMRLVHRVAYELAIGPIPDGLEIDHVLARGCTRTDCVNPAHLEAVTGYVNNMRSASAAATNAKATHCPKSHPYDTENTRINSRGDRKCVACERVQRKARSERERRKRITTGG